MAAACGHWTRTARGESKKTRSGFLSPLPRLCSTPMTQRSDGRPCQRRDQEMHGFIHYFERGVELEGWFKLRDGFFLLIFPPFPFFIRVHRRNIVDGKEFQSFLDICTLSWICSRRHARTQAQAQDTDGVVVVCGVGANRAWPCFRVCPLSSMSSMTAQFF